MAASGRNFHGPLDVFLAHDIGEIGRISQVAGESIVQVHTVGFDLAQTGEVGDQIAQGRRADDVDVGHEGRFASVHFRYDDLLEAL